MLTATDRLTDKNIVQITLPTPFAVGPVNVFLFKGETPILFDTGLKNDESYTILEKALAAEGYAFSDLAAIVITHGHRDHNGMLGKLQQETDARTYGHPLVREQGLDAAEGGEATKQFYIGIMREFGVSAEIIEEANSLYNRFRSYSDGFRIDQVLEDGGNILGFKTFFVPGHSPSDTLFVHDELGITIVGDHILKKTNPNPLLRRPKQGETRAKALVEYQASLKKSRSLDLKLCLPGHGEPFEPHQAVVDGILDRQEQRTQKVLAMVKEGDTTPYLISRKLFPSLENKHLHMGLSIGVGHMEVLEERGELRSEHMDGVLHFYERA